MGNGSATTRAASPATTAGLAVPSRIAGVFTPGGLAALGLLSAAFVAVFYRWFRQQTAFSLGYPEDWAHAFVIPLISLYMLWRRREALATLRIDPFWPAITPVLLGLWCYLFFLIYVPNHMLGGAAMLLTLYGLVLLTLGTRGGRELFLPIAFLVFGITISEAIMNDITFRLQLIASQGSFAVLSLMGAFTGFTTDIQGNVITVITPSGIEHPMNVAEACSGMRMVIAFIALAGAVAVLGCKEWWQRVAVLLLAVPVAIGMNVVRVVVLGLLMFIDPDLSQGEAHMLIGTLLLIPALGLFLGAIWALNQIFAPATPKGAES